MATSLQTKKSRAELVQAIEDAYEFTRAYIAEQYRLKVDRIHSDCNAAVTRASLAYKRAHNEAQIELQEKQREARRLEAELKDKAEKILIRDMTEAKVKRQKALASLDE